MLTFRNAGRRLVLAAFVYATLIQLSWGEEKPLHVFILSGQSNMVGMNPKIGFEDEAAKLLPDAEVQYCKVARGGQPIRLWVEQWDEIASKHGLEAKRAETKYYQPILDEYAKIVNQHGEPTSVTFCWMQGERDAKEGLSAAYFDALSQLTENLRRDLKQPQMNVVIARLSDFGDAANAHWQATRKAQVDLAKQDPHGAWVDCDDLNNKEKNGVVRNDLHYTREGYELLGRRFARQAKALIDGKQPAENGRPE
jgi:hypothetical protein